MHTGRITTDLAPARIGKPGSAEQFEKIDRAFGTLIVRLAGTQSRIVATADHGFLDVAPEESLEAAPRACGDAQVSPVRREARAYCYVHSPAQFMEQADSGWETVPTCGRAASCCAKAGSVPARRIRASTSAWAT